MTTIDRTAYPRFRATLTPTELHDHFTPTAKELALAEAHTRDDAVRLAFLVLYKCFQCLGYLPRDQEIPPEVIAHLRWYLPRGHSPAPFEKRCACASGASCSRYPRPCPAHNPWLVLRKQQEEEATVAAIVHIIG